MTDFALPANLLFNCGLIDDPRAYARERGVQSWLFLVGDEFAEEVLRAAERDQAPFCAAADIEEWLRTSLEALRMETDVPATTQTARTA